MTNNNWQLALVVCGGANTLRSLLSTTTTILPTLPGTVCYSTNSQNRPLGDNTAQIMMPSEKAKGKQRAMDLPTPDPSEPAPELSLALVIRFTEGIPDLTCDVSQQDSIRDVKRKVRFPPFTPWYFCPGSTDNDAGEHRSKTRGRSCKTAGCG